MLSAGQRRSATANTIIRDPQWRPKDPAGALWMNPADASELGIQNGGRVRIITKRASAESVVVLTDTMHARSRRAAERDGTVVPRPRRPGISARGRAQRADGDRGSRLVRGHAVSQARAGANRGGCLMRRTRFDHWPCPIARTTDLVGDWWTPLVMREAFSGRRRFEDFQRALKVPRAVLARRLDRLVDEGLLKKVSYQEHPPRLRIPSDRQGTRVLGRARRDVAMGQRLAVGRKWSAGDSRRPRNGPRSSPAGSRREHRHSPDRPPPAHGPQATCRPGAAVTIH